MQSMQSSSYAPSCSYTLPTKSAHHHSHHNRSVPCVRVAFCQSFLHVHRKAAAHAGGCCRTQYERSSSPSSALIRLSQQHTAAASRLVANSATLTRGPQTSLPELNIQQPAGTADKVGVLLLNLGGPETLDDVEHFLFNLFNDPDIIRLPGQGTQQQWCF